MPQGKSGIKIGLHSERTMKGHGHKMLVKILKYPIKNNFVIFLDFVRPPLKRGLSKIKIF